jgi:putative ABC transport system substrate-binding protein
MKRREFITFLGGATAAWPLAVRAQQPAMPVIGFLNPARADTFQPFLTAFRRGLGEAGYVEGQNVMIEFRWADGRYDRLPELASDLVRRGVALIAAGGGDVTAQAAKAATSTVPIIFISTDPVTAGLAASFNHPGSNATGVSLFTVELEAKKLDLLIQLLPMTAVIGALINPNSPSAEYQLRTVEEAMPRAGGRQLLVLKATDENGLGAAFAALAEHRSAALLVTGDSFFTIRRDKLVALAASRALPVIYHYREFAAAGGLMSYGPSLADAYRQVGVFAGKILKGARPADLPVERPTKFELVLNLKTAKALGLDVPPTLIALADEVIE